MPFVCVLVLWLVAQTMIHAAPDEIDAWAQSFNSLRLNGITPNFDLPENTPIEKIVEAVAQDEKRSDQTGQFHNYRIIEAKKIDQPNSQLYGYTVALITSDKGSKAMIVLNYLADHPAPPSDAKIISGDGTVSTDNKNALRHLGWTARCFFITTVP